MLKKSSLSFLLLFLAILPIFSAHVGEEGAVWGWGPPVKKEDRRSLVSTEYGQISAVRISDNISAGSYLLHFFTLEPNSLLLPLILHADMVFYVHTGSGKLSWTEDDDLKHSNLRRGDVYRLQQGTVFYVHSNLETDQTERQKLRIHAIFANSDDDLHEPATGPYSSIRDMVLGFDKKVLQSSFKVSEEVIEELLNGTKPPSIVQGVPKSKKTAWEMEAQFIRGLVASRSYNIFESNKKKKKESAKLFNLFKEDKDFENCNGWSTTVTRKKLSVLKGSNIGLFMVNLTTGSMMGPHWNPMATEIAVVLQGQGMVRVVCSSLYTETECRNMRFKVEEGDVFAVPKFHPMAQMAFNNDTFVFVGFSTSTTKNHPQFLAGQASVFRTLDKDVLALSFNSTNATLDQLLAAQHDSVILGCTSCAEEEWRKMEEDVEKEKEEEEAKKREEERRREEEEARKREEEAARKEEEERKKRQEEEEARKREEEARKEEEERKEREEEEARKREEEARKEEEERKKRKEEEEEEEAREARKREEEARKEEEERKKREEEEERQKEEEEARQQEREREREEERREEEEARKREEEARREEEERKKREEEKEARQREEEQAAEEEERREEEAEREEEEARQQERERERQQEEGGREEKEEHGGKEET